MNVNPQFLDLVHISSTSPCRGTGNSFYASGADLDGEPWVTPPSIGCDEVIVSNLIGPLSVAIKASVTNGLAGHYLNFSGSVTGLVAHVTWSFGDGPTVTNVGIGSSHAWANPGDYEVIFTAYNTDNPAGVSTNLFVHISPVNRPLLEPLLAQSNSFQFLFPGETSVYYTIQSATNLAAPVNWQAFQYVYAYTDGVYLIKDPSATNGTRFYRVIAQ